MKNKAENVASRRVDAKSRGHSLLTSKLYTPVAHLKYLFRVSEYQPSANVAISNWFLRWMIFSSIGWLYEYSSGREGDRIIIPTNLNGRLIRTEHREFIISLDRNKKYKILVVSGLPSFY